MISNFLDAPVTALPFGTPDLLAIIEDELQQRGSASRAHLEVAALKRGIAPHEFTAELQRLRDENRLPQPFEIVSSVYSGRPTHVYAPNALDTDALERWRKQVNDEHAFLDTREQQKAGEQYARAVLRRARSDGAQWFGRITQRHRLGNIWIAEDSKADLLVEYSFPDAHFGELLVEVKNARERFDISSVIFPKLMQSALDTGRLPALILAHVSPRAAAFCEDAGIALLHLGRRIVDKKKRSRARTIFGARANEEFQFVRLNRVFTEPIADDIRSHVNLISQRDWVAYPDLRWHENRHRLQRTIDLLDSGEWQRAAREIATAGPLQRF